MTRPIEFWCTFVFIEYFVVSGPSGAYSPDGSGMGYMMDGQQSMHIRPPGMAFHSFMIFFFTMLITTCSRWLQQCCLIKINRALLESKQFSCPVLKTFQKISEMPQIFWKTTNCQKLFPGVEPLK